MNIMSRLLLWIGIGITVIGWIALAWQASKRMVRKDDIRRFPELQKTMQLYRNYCWLTMIGGVILILVSILIC